MDQINGSSPLNTIKIIVIKSKLTTNKCIYSYNLKPKCFLKKKYF